MQMIDEVFPGYLSKFNAKTMDDDVVIEFVITYVSKNEMSETFMNTFSEMTGTHINEILKYTEWDNIKYSIYHPNLNIKFDVMDINADLSTIKITQKEKANESVVKYDMTFLKKQEKDIDTYLSTYLKHKDIDSEGKKYLSEYDILITE